MEKKERFIAALREENRHSQHPDIFDQQDLSILLFLGDSEGREQLVKRFLDSDGLDSLTAVTLSNSGDPEVIPMLSGALMKSEPYRRFGTDAGTFPLSFNATDTIVRLVAASSAFRGDVIGWARQLARRFPPTSIERELIRKWWNINKPYFDQKNYQAVLPGGLPHYGVVHQKMPDATPTAVVNSENQNRAANPMSHSAAVGDVRRRDSDTDYWVIVLICLAGIGCVGYVWAKR